MTPTTERDIESFPRPERTEPCHLCGKDRCEVIWMGRVVHVACAQASVTGSAGYESTGGFTNGKNSRRQA